MPKRVVSISLGSARRDHRVALEFLGEPFELERIGTDGSLDKAMQLLRAFDGQVDAIGLGGIDVYLYAGATRFALRDGLRLLEVVERTPVVDGSGLKNTLERRSIATLEHELGILLVGKRVLMVSALDRFGMAQAFVAAGADVMFGDFIFALDVDKPVRDLEEFESLAKRYLPDACRLPFQFFYPTGKRQDRPSEPKYPHYYEEAEIIAGDFHFMRRYMPARIDGKIIVTNTITAGDIEDLRSRGAAYVVTTTPEMQGRSFGTNVLEAALVAHLGRAPAAITQADYEDLITRFALRPRVLAL